MTSFSWRTLYWLHLAHIFCCLWKWKSCPNLGLQNSEACPSFSGLFLRLSLSLSLFDGIVINSLPVFLFAAYSTAVNHSRCSSVYSGVPNNAELRRPKPLFHSDSVTGFWLALFKFVSFLKVLFSKLLIIGFRVPAPTPCAFSALHYF